MNHDVYLSDQQRKIIKLLDEGHTWADAADELDIAQSTLEEQMRRVRVKRERCEATLDWLAEHGQTPDDRMEYVPEDGVCIKLHIPDDRVDSDAFEFADES